MVFIQWVHAPQPPCNNTAGVRPAGPSQRCQTITPSPQGVSRRVAFAATTGAVKDHHFDALFNAYIADEKVRTFMAKSNPAALKETAAKFAEALRRDLWKPRSNRAHDLLEQLSQANYGEAVQ